MYNLNQQQAIESQESDVVIVAPPGSGKTLTMVGAVEKFIKNDSPWTVVITFTNKAADELKERLSFNPEIEISTIHSWSYRELIRLSQQYNFRVRVLEEEQIKEILIPIMRDHRVSQNSLPYVYSHVLGNINPDLYPSVREKYKAIRRKYIEYKRKMYLYDFTDLPLYLKNMLEEYDEYIYIDGLFVDEFQDVDPDQLAVFNRVKANKKFFIGDVDQAIYIFRGATEEVFKQLPGFKFYKLNTNYRSYQEILNFAYDFKKQSPENILRTTFTNTSGHGVIAEKGKGAVIIQELDSIRMDSNGMSYLGVKYENGTEEQKGMWEFVLEELKNYDYQFLCRTNREVRKLEQMGFTDVSTVHKAKGLEYDNVAVINFDIKEEEDINVAFVALTRAKNRLMILSMADYLKKGAAKKAF